MVLNQKLNDPAKAHPGMQLLPISNKTDWKKKKGQNF